MTRQKLFNIQHNSRIIR